MRIILAVFVAVTLAMLMSGCGGGGGASSPAAQLAPVELNTVYTYDISVVSGRAEGLTGTLALTIVRDGDVLSKQGLVELDDGGRSFSSDIAAFFTQDASGSMFYAGKRNTRDGTSAISDSRALSIKSPLRSGDAWSSSAILEGGSTESWRSVVGARESVAAGGVIFNAYPIETARQNLFGNSVCTAWYSPEHPVPVKAVGQFNGLHVVIVLTQLGKNSSDLDSPPAPPMSDGGSIGAADFDFDAPPAPPVGWEQRGQDVAAIICEMLN